ncbi:TON1 Recruiting Motif 28 [Hibiscus trionum]|uniref:TON1 Recruiting Motif 28 n=1 Tax=Hibiscus trionum TaxID=183268 RepID=A0A9W7MT79_HIBTR|nr:TON1 Recruiting Motif 28 [Hibiscus trionum]
MAQKHLHELLEEDQEPFVLKNYIADRRCQLRKPSPITHLQINKRKPISQNSNFPSDFCKKACFFSTLDSPDLIKKSPLFEAKSPNTMFLLEAALSIQNQSSSKTKSQNKNSNGTGFGLFGSILKKLTHRNKNPERETANRGSKVSVRDILKWDLTLGKNNVISEEKIEEKFMDSEKISMSNGVLEHISAFDNHFSQSPFHFVLQTTPSPSRHEREVKENYELQSLKRFQVEEEEEEEQCSPVSVLDRPFEDDDGHVDDEDDDGDSGMDRFDLEGTYAIVQRAKQQFLQKLRRFEKLAELDPIELETRMLEQEQDDDNDAESSSSQSEMNIDCYNLKHIPDCMKRLVSDLIAEEETSRCNGSIDEQLAAERACKRLDSWKDVESNTIDMMVEQDFRRDQIEGWKGNEEQVRETAIEVERGIFGLLMQELSELVFLTGV